MTHLNAFTLRLTDYIIHNHPDRITDTAFIEQRGQAALTTFAECSRQGMSFEDANHQAAKVLYQGLLFSPYHMIIDILDEEFPNVTLVDTQRGSLLMQMLAFVKPTIARYHNEDNDDTFRGSYRYATAYAHTKRMINQFLHDNGLQ